MISFRLPMGAPPNGEAREVVSNYFCGVLAFCFTAFGWNGGNYYGRVSWHKMPVRNLRASQAERCLDSLPEKDI